FQLSAGNQVDDAILDFYSREFRGIAGGVSGGFQLRYSCSSVCPGGCLRLVPGVYWASAIITGAAERAVLRQNGWWLVKNPGLQE
ncbi:MAG: hypothetical protein KTR32_10800, partial [Granulosicoccus sp.]|nr:hypothetical protein [Granulosicoccus sp.]